MAAAEIREAHEAHRPPTLQTARLALSFALVVAFLAHLAT
jgi:hypothetical protein